MAPEESVLSMGRGNGLFNNVTTDTDCPLAFVFHTRKAPSGTQSRRPEPPCAHSNCNKSIVRCKGIVIPTRVEDMALRDPDGHRETEAP